MSDSNVQIDYFKLLDLDPSIQLDPQQLEKSYLKVYTQSAITDQSIINNAYQTLKDSHKRVEHFLNITYPHSIHKDIKVSQEFLIKTIELFEQIESLVSYDEIDSMQQQVLNEQQSHHQHIELLIKQRKEKASFIHYSKAHYYQRMLHILTEKKFTLS